MWRNPVFPAVIQHPVKKGRPVHTPIVFRNSFAGPLS